MLVLERIRCESEGRFISDINDGTRICLGADYVHEVTLEI